MIGVKLFGDDAGVLKIGQNIGKLEVFAHICITAEVKISMSTYIIFRPLIDEYILVHQ